MNSKMPKPVLDSEVYEIAPDGSKTVAGGWIEESVYPPMLAAALDKAPALQCQGDLNALLRPSVAIIGPRKATPYGLACARRFAALAVESGLAVVSGGARGCDTAAMEAALDAGGCAVAVIAGGLDHLYPQQNTDLFRRAVDAGGAVATMQRLGVPPLPYMFRARNAVVAGLSGAVLIAEAGLPSGTFSTANDALAAGREVLAVPGPITSHASAGANALLLQGATPVIDDATFLEAAERVKALFG